MFLLDLQTSFSNAINSDNHNLQWRDDLNFQLVRHININDRELIIYESKLKHAKYNIFATALAIPGCLKCLKDSFEKDRLGIIVVGGPLNCPVAWNFTEKLIKDGERLVNPLYFPHTILSSVSCTIASNIGAKAFAFNIGFDHHAFFDVLKRACQSIRYDYCEQALAVAVFDSNFVVLKAKEKILPDVEFGDTAICGLLRISDGKSKGLIIIDYVNGSCLDEVLESTNYDEEFDLYYLFFEECKIIRSNYKSILREFSVFTATGAVMLMEAAKIAWHKNNKTKPFLMVCEADGRASGILLQWKD